MCVTKSSLLASLGDGLPELHGRAATSGYFRGRGKQND